MKELRIDNPYAVRLSKNRNSKETFAVKDAAGNPIKGSSKKHFNRAAQKIQERFNSKLAEFKEYDLDKLREIYSNKDKDYLGSKTDEGAFGQVYFKKYLDSMEHLTLEELKALDLSNMNYMEKLVLNTLFKSKEKKSEEV